MPAKGQGTSPMEMFYVRNQTADSLNALVSNFLILISTSNHLLSGISCDKTDGWVLWVYHFNFYIDTV